MNSLKIIFTIGIIIMIFPLLGLPSAGEDAILIIAGIVLLVASLALRKDVPHTRKVSPENSSFSENGVHRDAILAKMDNGDDDLGSVVEEKEEEDAKKETPKKRVPRAKKKEKKIELELEEAKDPDNAVIDELESVEHEEEVWDKRKL